jgi:hypothetical protein
MRMKRRDQILSITCGGADPLAIGSEKCDI